MGLDEPATQYNCCDKISWTAYHNHCIVVGEADHNVVEVDRGQHQCCQLEDMRDSYQFGSRDRLAVGMPWLKREWTAILLGKGQRKGGKHQTSTDVVDWGYLCGWNEE